MQGSLILSKNAGASKQMHSAWLVDPDNPDAIKKAIMLAAMATASEKERRMQDLRDNVFKYNADFWADSFLQKLEKLSIGK
jgi:trehalose 6-phosphate synthase